MVYRLSKFFLLILFFFALDQISKNIIIQLYNIDVENLSSQYLTSINEYVNLYLIWNKGFAFGLFQNDIRTVNNIYMILMAVVIFVVFIYALTINSKVYYYGFSLIIGGALGNLFDRYQYAAVLDFIDVHYNNFHWYVFNIADINITLGCILIIILELFSNRKKKNEI